MRKFFISVSVLSMALATSTPVQASASKVMTPTDCKAVMEHHGAAIRKKMEELITSGAADSWLAAATHYVDYAKPQLSNINCVGKVNPGDMMAAAKVSNATPLPAAATSTVASASHSVEATKAPAGGGAMLDAEIAELRRQRATGEASSEVLTRLAALEARSTSVSAGPDLRPQIGRLERQLSGLRSRPAATLNATDRQLLQQLPGQIAEMRKAQAAAEKARDEAQTSAATASGAATTATTASAAAQGHSTSAATFARNAAASAGWLEGHKLLIYLALVLGLISLLWAGLLQRSKASKKEVRTSVCISDESRKALDTTADGDKVSVELLVHGESYCKVEFEKAPDGSFHPTADIGDTTTGTPVRDVEAFLRRCYWQRQAVLNDFR